MINVIKRTIRERYKFIRRKKEKKTKERNIYKICIILILFMLNIIMNTPILNIPNIFDKNKIKNNTSNNKNNTSNYGRFFLCTIYNNEAEMLYIQLWRLYDYVDKFIIIISNMTHSGVPKKFTFKSFKKNIKPYMKKVDIVNFNNICKKRNILLLIKFGVFKIVKEIMLKLLLKKNIILQKGIF